MPSPALETPAAEPAPQPAPASPAASPAGDIDPTKPLTWLKLIKEELPQHDIQSLFSQFVDHQLKRLKMEEYHIVFLYDTIFDISPQHANQIYDALSSGVSDKNILLVIHSDGGSVEPAYLISKTCRKRSKKKFIVAIPRRAKSAATLISLGASEIHMGIMSELGPIDPQIRGLPALGLKNALSVLANLACDKPGSAEMFSRYLKEKLDLGHLGYFERVSESAAQYAERLLTKRKYPGGRSTKELADHFVSHYKDHGFVIDIDEATLLLGEGVVKTETPEYRFANLCYAVLDLLNREASRIAKRKLHCVGAPGDCIRFFPLEEEKG